MADDEKLTRFIKDRDQVVGKVKVEDKPSVQGTRYSEKYLVLRERFQSSTERPKYSDTVTGGSNVPVVQEMNDDHISNSQYTPVSM